MRTEGKREHTRWLKRQAIQVVSQLPESEEDALKILEHAKDLIYRFMREDVGRAETRALRLVSNFEEDERP